MAKAKVVLKTMRHSLSRCVLLKNSILTSGRYVYLRCHSKKLASPSILKSVALRRLFVLDVFMLYSDFSHRTIGVLTNKFFGRTNRRGDVTKTPHTCTYTRYQRLYGPDIFPTCLTVAFTALFFTSFALSFPSVLLIFTF